MSIAAIALAAIASSRVTGVVDAQRRPNFASDIAPIVYASCAGCHRPDQPTPLVLLSYGDLQSHAKEVLASVTSRRMPPWSAASAPGFPVLQHAQRLTDRQIGMFTAWVDAGMPPGDLTKAPLPPSFPASWVLGVPDLTVSLPRPISIPADTADRMFNVVFSLNFPVDRWITGIDYQPSERSLLSQAIVFAVPSSLAIDTDDPLPGFGGLLGAGSPAKIVDELIQTDRSIRVLDVWTRGGRPWPVPDGMGLLLPKRFNIVMQFHARAADTGAIEDGTLALYFAKTRAVPLSSLQLPSSLGVAAGIDLPAGAAATVVSDEFTLPVDVTAYGARGHGHDFARDMKMTARLPNGSARGLLWIDRWDVARQETYYFTSPVRLPKGTTVRVDIKYDTSSANHRVGWGPLLSNEIGSMDLLIAEPDGVDAQTLAAAREEHFRQNLAKRRPGL